MEPDLSDIDDATLRALDELGADEHVFARADYFGVAHRLAQGPREEAQDIPFCFHLAFVDGAYVHFESGLERAPSDWEQDVVVAGIIDGMGGVALPLKLERATALAPLFDTGDLISKRFKARTGDFLTGRAAARVLFESLRRRVTQMRADALDFSLIRLVNTINAALFEMTQFLIERDLAEPPIGGGIGAALTISVLKRDGQVAYANCGDCRAGIIRGEGEPRWIEELSSKQTEASLENVTDRTTVGLARDNRILNALGLAAKAQPSLKTTTLGPRDVLIHLTDGTKEALMYSSVLRDLPWDERTLKETFRHVVLPRVDEGGRSFPLLHGVFEESVRPHLATDPDDTAGLADDNASLLIMRRVSGGDAAMDGLYQAIERGDVAVERAPFSASAQELRRIAAMAGVIEVDELSRFFELARASGLEIRGT